MIALMQKEADTGSTRRSMDTNCNDMPLEILIGPNWNVSQSIILEHLIHRNASIEMIQYFCTIKQDLLGPDDCSLLVHATGQHPNKKPRLFYVFEAL